MNLEETPSDPTTPGAPLASDAFLRHKPMSHRLARLSYPLACAGPFAFLIMAIGYPQTNPKALPAPIIQILWWALCLASPLGAILGALALLQIRLPSRGYSRLSADYGKAGLIVGILASAALLLGTPVLTGIRRDNHNAHRYSCLSNIKQLGTATLMYAQDYDDHVPLPATWNTSLFPYTRNDSILHCSEASEDEKRPTYAMSRLEGMALPRLYAPDRTAMLFDSIPGKNLTGGRELLPNPPRHSGMQTIGFVDGHAKPIREEDLLHVIWHPQLDAKAAKAQAKPAESPLKQTPQKSQGN